MGRVVELSGRPVGRGESIFLIGEIGVNHNGDVGIARKLIDSADELGLDAVKFQSFRAERLVLKGTSKTDYQLNTTGVEGDQFGMLKSLELSQGEIHELMGYAENKGLVFICTPYDPLSAGELAEIGIKVIKISSADLVDALLLRAVAAARVPVILSTGMSGLEDTRRAVNLLEREGVQDIILLHCVSMYPTPEQALNLRFIEVLYDTFDYPVGFSDHTMGSAASPLAVAAGACVIEKHFTLDSDMEGPDHRASLDPDGMRVLVERVRAAEKMLGTSEKEIAVVEQANADLMRKSLVFAQDLPAGTILTYEHLAAKRPATGVSPMEYENFVGLKLARDVKMDELLIEELFRPLEE